MAPRLSDLVTLLKGHRVFIQTHNFPDPDASAYGLQVLLGKFNIPTTICHHGNVERTATANMVSEFGIKMTCDDDLKDMKSEDYIITVDSQKGNANILDLVGDEVACIDHHPTFCEATSTPISVWLAPVLRLSRTITASTRLICPRTLLLRFFTV